MTKAQQKKYIKDVTDLRVKERERMYDLMIKPFDNIIAVCNKTKKGKLGLAQFIEANLQFSHSLEEMSQRILGDTDA